MLNVKHGTIRTRVEQKMAKALIKEGIRFEQNYFLKGYEVDFWIERAGLVIEIDGFSHLSKEKSTSDQIKDRKLCDQGYTVIRFTNHQIYNNLIHCVQEVKTIIYRTKKCFYKQGDSVNSVWKEALKPIRENLKSIETEAKRPMNIEAQFLSLEEEID